MYALGTFLNTRRKESDHGESIEHRIACNLLKSCGDGSSLVRKVRFSWDYSSKISRGLVMTHGTRADTGLKLKKVLNHIKNKFEYVAR